MAEPRYRAIARELREQIAQGQWSVGQTLPSEPLLAGRYEVSRETVRAALRELEADDLISRGRGSPTRVQRREPTVAFAALLDSIDDLTQYGLTAVRSVLEQRSVVVDAELARRTGLPVGARRVEITAARDVHSREGAASWALTYLEHADASAIQADLGDGGVLICDLVSARTGRRPRRVVQRVRAIPLPDAAAPVLHLEAASPALEIVRRYHDEADGLMQVTVAVHPAETFVYETVLQRQIGHRT